MRLSHENLESVVGYFLEHGPGRLGFIRLNLKEIEHLKIVVKPDGPDILITSYDDLARITDRFPILPNMGS